MTSDAYEALREALDSHGRKISSNRANSFMAQCPHHEDGEASLSVTDKGDRVLLHCHAGCGSDEIMVDLGMALADLFDGEPTKDRAVPIRSYLYETPDGRPWFWKDRYYPKTFICRAIGTEPGDRRGIGGRLPVLYRAPALRVAMDQGTTIWFVDGEKDVETAERNGLVATTTPHGSGSRWLPEYSSFLSRAKEVVIVVDQDKAKADGTLGSGQQHALDAKAGLRSVGVKVRLVAPAIGKDLTDHFAAGYGEVDFVRDTSASFRPRGTKVTDLMGKTFPALVYCVEGVLPSGLAILAGAPKAGKSWVALDMAIGVSCGGRSMSTLDCTQGSVLYLAREDGERRIQARVELLTRGDPGGAGVTQHLEVISADQDWIGGEIGLAAMTEWAEEVGDPRLVVLDTWAKVDPMMDDRNMYRAEYAVMAGYKRWADLHNCTVLMVHHVRKGSGQSKPEDRDPFTEISGTRGVTGAADTLMVLDTKRGTKEGTLHLTGRDVGEQALELRKFGPLWTCVDRPDPV